MNSAQRLLNIYSSFSGLGSSHSMNTAWQAALGLPQTGSLEEVIPCCMAAMREVRQLEKQLRSIGVPDSVYAEAVNQLLNAFPPTHLNQPWGNFQSGMSQRAVPLTLEWASWALSKFDEPDLDPESLNQLQQSLVEQEALLRDATIPESLRTMLESQIENIRTALLLYKIAGRKPLYDAVNQQVGAIRNALPEDVVAAAATPEGESILSKAVEIVKKAGTLAENGSKVFKFSKEAASVIALGWEAGKVLLT